jgi:hypothetical protein
MSNGSSLVSICIPAWERPALLLVAVESCLAQTYDNIEIVVADDSRSDAVRRVLQRLVHIQKLRYSYNAVRLGQAENVNHAFDLARGERLVLLHDDDVLFADAIEGLDRGWRDNDAPLACYGKRVVVTHSGAAVATLPRAACEPARTPVVTSNLWHMLAGDFPPDGFMVAAETARAVRYRNHGEVGDACDVDFNFRLAAQRGKICFVDQFISKYRITDISVSTQSETVDHAFFLVKNLKVPPDLECTKQLQLQKGLARAVRLELLFGQRSMACQLMRECLQSWNAVLSLRTLVHLSLLLLPRRPLYLLYSSKRALQHRVRRSGTIYRLRAWLKTRLTRARRRAGSS